jgi:hypothetical protein
MNQIEEYKIKHKEKKKKIDDDNFSKVRKHEYTKPLEEIYTWKGELQKVEQYDEKIPK